MEPLSQERIIRSAGDACPVARQTSPLYRWLWKHHDLVQWTLVNVGGWPLILSLAREDGIETGETDRKGRNRAHNAWLRVKRTRAKWQAGLPDGAPAVDRGSPTGGPEVAAAPPSSGAVVPVPQTPMPGVTPTGESMPPAVIDDCPDKYAHLPPNIREKLLQLWETDRLKSKHGLG